MNFQIPNTKTLIPYAYALITALLTTQLLSWINQFFFIAFSAAVGWLFFAKWNQKQGKKNPFAWSDWWIAAPFLVLLVTRVMIFVRFGDYPPLGYDMGIYKYEFERAASLGAALKTSFYPGLIVLVSLLQKIGLGVGFFMREFYILLNLLIGLMVYLAGRQFFGKKAGFLALILYAASLTQFTAYYFFLYKNVLALSLLLGTFMLLDRRSWWAIPAGLYLGVVQPPDFLILAAAMLAMFVYQWKDKAARRYLLRTGGVIGGLFLAVFLFRFNQIIEGIRLILHHQDHWDPSISGGGVFIDFRQYVEQAIYYLPLVLIGWIASFRLQRGKNQSKPALNYLHFAFLATLGIVLFKLIFYKRYIIELDVLAILFGGAGAAALLQWYAGALWRRAAWAAFGVAMLAVMVLESGYAGPLIPQIEAARINTLCKLPRNAFIMATDSFYSPWVRGYGCHDTIAPGLFEWNTWNQEQWQRFWSGQKEAVEPLMEEWNAARRPVYLFVGDFQPKIDFSGMRGFTRLRSYLWRWDFVRK